MGYAQASNIISVSDEQVRQLMASYMASPTSVKDDQSDAAFFSAEFARVTTTARTALGALMSYARGPHRYSPNVQETIGLLGPQATSLRQLCVLMEAVAGLHSPATELEILVASWFLIGRYHRLTESIG